MKLSVRAVSAGLGVVLVGVGFVAVVRAQRAPATVAATSGSGVRLVYAQQAGRRVRVTTRVRQTAPSSVGDTVVTTRGLLETVSVGTDAKAHRVLTLERVGVEGFGITSDVRGWMQEKLAGMRLEFDQNAQGVIESRTIPATTPADIRPLVEGVFQSVEDEIVPLPATSIAVGGQWIASRTVPFEVSAGMHITLQLESTYTLKSTTSDRLEIDQQTTVRIPVGSNVAGLAVEATGTARGAHTLSLRDGWSTRSAVSGSINVTFAIHERPQHVDLSFESRSQMEEVSP